MARSSHTADVNPLLFPRRRSGSDRFVFRAGRRLVRTVVRWGHVVFFSRALAESVPSSTRTDGFRVREASEHELRWLLDGADPDQTTTELRRRFRRGDRCFVGVDSTGRAAHVRWATTRRAYVPELNRDVVLRPGEVYFYNGYTRPDARGRGLDGLVRQEIFRTFAACGCRTAWSYVRSDNPIGRRAAERWQSSGGSIRYLTIPGVLTLVGGERAPGLPVLERAVAGGDDDRAVAWGAWFAGWRSQPLTRRSTGYHDLPAEYFASAADFIAASLHLDREADAVLDVGCDSAMVSRLLVDRCRQFTGVDFIPGMLADAREVTRTHATRAPWFVASDGRRLPFRTASFSKAYCSAVIHTLPSREDGLAVVRELVRVCRPNGQVLVASVPDVRKRWAGRREALRQASWLRRPLLIGYWLLPATVTAIVKRAVGRPRHDPMAFLEYDLAEMARSLEAAGHRCHVLDFPADYWSSDFRTTRSSLLISVAPDRA